MDQQVTQTQTEKEELSPNLVMTPGKMRVIKRNGKVVSFEEEKIKVAIMKAFLAVEGGTAVPPSTARNAFIIATFIFSSSKDTTFPFLFMTLIFPGVITRLGDNSSFSVCVCVTC